MDIVTQRNIGSLVALATSVRPQSASAGTINGAAVDRAAHNTPYSCVLHTTAGAVSGAPTATSAQSKIQDSADGTNFADYLPDGVNIAQAAALTAANTENALSVDLGNARRYIRAVTIVSFTGGTTPAVLVAADVVIGGEDTLAAV